MVDIRHFERRARTFTGPRRGWWRRGVTYTISGITVLRFVQLLDAMAKHDVQHPELTLEGLFRTFPLEVARAMVLVLFVSERVDERDSRKIGWSGVLEVLRQADEVTDFSYLAEAMPRLTKVEGGFLGMLCELGERFGVWPAELARQPLEAVLAAAEQCGILPAPAEGEQRQTPTEGIGSLLSFRPDFGGPHA